MDNNSVNKKQYRRLKHYKTSINFYIKTKPRSDLEQKIINNVDEYVDIKIKYKNRNQTKSNDIKKIDLNSVSKDTELYKYMKNH